MPHVLPAHSTSLQALGFPESCKLARDPEVDIDELGERLQLLLVIDTREAPRGYLESVEQRLRLLGDCERSVLNCEGWQGDPVSEFEYELRIPFYDGESLPLYLEKMTRQDGVDGFRILSDVIHWFLRLARQPRIFSNVTSSDFSLTSIGGTVGVGLVPLSAILNPETTKTDRQIAQFWLSYLVALVEKVLPKRSFGDSSKEIISICRQQLDEIRSGRAHELNDWFRVILDSVESQQMKWKARSPRTRLRPPRPSHGILGSFLWSAFSESEGESSLDWITLETPYSALVSKKGGGKNRIRLLFPDSWTQKSMLDGVNRKMAHPFLKQHHNGFRTLSVSCGEGYSALVGTGEEHCSLSALLSMKSDLPFDEMHILLRRIHRAIEQFESADFQAEISSLHQVFVCFEEENHDIETLQKNFLDWPAWDVKLRVEPPIEKFMDQSGWRTLFQRNGRKFFPSFACWALDYSRFQWVEQAGRLEAEPSSWDVDLESLLTTAAKHLDEKDPVQRRKFIELLEEWNLAQVPSLAFR